MPREKLRDAFVANKKQPALPPLRLRGATAAERIRHAREQRGLTRRDLAVLVGCSDASIYFWEQGRHLPKPIYGAALAAALAVPAEALRLAA